MMRLLSRIPAGAALLLLLLSLAALPAGAAVDPFYQGLLRDGQLAFDAKDYGNAARQLRLACFGMLDDPQPLADCLSRLALAQDGAGDVEGVRETCRRLIEVEDRFKGYSQAEIAPERRAALETRLAARIPAATLAGAPAFRSTQKKAAAPAPTHGASATKTPSKPAPAPASPIAALPPQAPDPAPAAPPPGATTKPAATPAPAAGKPLADAERKKLDQARQLLAEQRPSKELRQAFELARAVADSHPDSREAQLLAAEGAYRISRWSDAATYFKRGGDPGEDEPERLFYMAVSLYESGDAPAASTALKRALPHLQRTPYVDSYARKILGQ
jgi:tetratricopeptide (TPR) repeat protein